LTQRTNVKGAPELEDAVDVKEVSLDGARHARWQGPGRTGSPHCAWSGGAWSGGCVFSVGQTGGLLLLGTNICRPIAMHDT
jgi:hypothetical protein